MIHESVKSEIGLHSKKKLLQWIRTESVQQPETKAERRLILLRKI